jgi:hypothetical protein
MSKSTTSSCASPSHCSTPPSSATLHPKDQPLYLQQNSISIPKPETNGEKKRINNILCPHDTRLSSCLPTCAAAIMKPWVSIALALSSVRFTSGYSERRWVSNDLGAHTPYREWRFGKAEVEADPETNVAEWGEKPREDFATCFYWTGRKVR